MENNTTLLQDQSFEQLVGTHSENAQNILTNLWNDCIPKSESDLLSIIKAFKPQVEKWNTRLNLAKIENGDLVSEAAMNEQKKYSTSGFTSVIIPRFDAKTGKPADSVTKYYLKTGIGHLNIDKMTLKQLNKIQTDFTEDVKEFLDIALKFRTTQIDWNTFKKNPESYTPEEFGKLSESVTSSEKAYNDGLVKIGLSREKFDSKGTDVKTYIKGLQQLKKSEIDEASSRVQILRAELKIVTAILNKKRGNQNIEMVRKAGIINTGMIDSEVENMVTLPNETSNLTPETIINSESDSINA